jgi:hypothetical protein
MSSMTRSGRDSWLELHLLHISRILASNTALLQNLLQRLLPFGLRRMGVSNVLAASCSGNVQTAEVLLFRSHVQNTLEYSLPSV